MHLARPLPTYLVKRYHGWRATDYKENHVWYERLATEGQRPRTMLITCCDSRIQWASIFGAETGEFFIHRNIANLVPPFAPDGSLHGTSAAIEYAVTALLVSNVVVLGHSSCGGVKGCHDMCQGKAEDLEAETSFVGRWMDLLRPKYDVVKDINDEAKRLEALEKECVLTSLENLMTFPFVAERVENERLSLHGLWHQIASGGLEVYDPAQKGFVPL